MPPDIEYYRLRCFFASPLFSLIFHTIFAFLQMPRPAIADYGAISAPDMRFHHVAGHAIAIDASAAIFQHCLR